MTSVVFHGYFYLAGRTVSAWICGLDCGDYVVSDYGTVTVPYGSDDGGLFTPSFIAATAGERDDWGVQTANILVGEVTYKVPVVIGLPFLTRGSTLRPASQDDTKSPQGPALAKPREAAEFGVLLDQAVKISFGTNFGDTLEAAEFAQEDWQTVLPQNVQFAGVYTGTLTGDAGFDTALCWEITRPVPCTIASIGSFLESNER